MPSPWAAIRNAQTPIQADTPSVWAPIPEQPMEQSDTRSQNVVNHFGEGPGKTIPPALQSRLDEPSPTDQDISNTQEQLRKVRYAQTHPWGTPENHPGKLGKLAHVFSEIGNVAGSIVAPNVMANIPQTQLGMKANEERLTGRLNEEEKNKALENEQAATTAKTQLDTSLEPGKTKSLEDYQAAETNKINDDLAMGPSLARGHDYAVTKAIKEGRDPATDPIVQHYEDAIQALQKQPTDKGLQYQTAIDPATHKPHVYGLDVHGNKVADIGEHYERPMNINVGAPEHAFEFSDKQLETLAKPLRDRSDRIERMKITLAQGNPQSDALVAPELLTAMAGGQGSGLRMNEAEIARIVGGRSAWENLKANIQHWSTDPNAARSITPEQDAMIHKLVAAVDAKVQRKMEILNEAGSKLVDTADPKEQHRLVAETRQRLQQEDVQQGNAPAGADNEVYVNGQLVGHTVNGKYVPLGAH